MVQSAGGGKCRIAAGICRRRNRAVAANTAAAPDQTRRSIVGLVWNSVVRPILPQLTNAVFEAISILCHENDVINGGIERQP